MNKKHIFGIALILFVIAVAGVYFATNKVSSIFKKKEKFTGNFSIDSGYYAVDHDQFGGSGILSDPINQSRMMG